MILAKKILILGDFHNEALHGVRSTGLHIFGNFIPQHPHSVVLNLEGVHRELLPVRGHKDLCQPDVSIRVAEAAAPYCC